MAESRLNGVLLHIFITNIDITTTIYSLKLINFGRIFSPLFICSTPVVIYNFKNENGAVSVVDVCARFGHLWTGCPVSSCLPVHACPTQGAAYCRVEDLVLHPYWDTFR